LTRHDGRPCYEEDSRGTDEVAIRVDPYRENIRESRMADESGHSAVLPGRDEYPPLLEKFKIVFSLKDSFTSPFLGPEWILMGVVHEERPVNL
ncbi:hypothetical protein PMAYCL1PPCAC_21916, partial [Pristionchus mayeri]